MEDHKRLRVEIEGRTERAVVYSMDDRRVWRRPDGVQHHGSDSFPTREEFRRYFSANHWTAQREQPLLLRF